MITHSEINHLANLARLGLSESEKESLAVDLASILEYVKQLQGADVSEIELMNGGSQEVNKLREDNILEYWEEEKALRAKKLLEAASDKKDNYVRIPEVFSAVT